MTLTDEELRRLAATVSERREQTVADDILDLMLSKGERLQSDKEARCRAFASLLRSLLGDPAIQRWLGLAQERSQFRTAIEALKERVRKTDHSQSEEITNIIIKMEQTEQDIAAQIEQVADAEKKKRVLLDNVVKILRDLGCDERFDLPAVQMRLPKLG